MKRSLVLAALFGGGIYTTAFGQVFNIIGVSIPVWSNDAPSHATAVSVFSVSAPPFPFNDSLGIGYLINPVVNSGLGSDEFSLHDHQYVAARVPDPARAVITYVFDQPVAVDQLEVIQHSNGITQFEAFVGNSLATLTSIGTAFGTHGDVTSSTRGLFSEFEQDLFDFDNTVTGSVLQLVVTRTSLDDGWANYRIYPRDENGIRYLGATTATTVPEPSEWAAIAGAGLTLFAVARRSRR
jgi:hypothetical protein